MSRLDNRLVLGIDPGSACGWALIDCPHGSLRHSGVWTLQHGRLEGGGMMFLRLRKWVEEALELDVDLVAMEDVRRHKGTAAAHLYGGITSHVSSVAEALGVPYTCVGVGVWKKYGTGRGNASKDMVMEAALARWGRAANALTLDWQQDAADAAFIGLAAAHELGWLLRKGGTV